MTGDARSGKGPDELREQIEHTRGELGRTVEELAARADVKARAQDKGRQTKEQVSRTTARFTRRAWEKVPPSVHDTADRAAVRVRDGASRAGHAVQDRTPEPIRTRTDRGLRIAREHPGALLAGTAALGGAVLLVGRRRAGARH
ncbi:DUF3618 domain-containing protein [Streptomyces sp. NPDC098781]|uniref:DUF3618 domain-containing protein n=1 Tax=Streptomyces sp. NPDC098781 TaxID=3366097 RepID=UPI0038155582